MRGFFPFDSLRSLRARMTTFNISICALICPVPRVAVCRIVG